MAIAEANQRRLSTGQAALNLTVQTRDVVARETSLDSFGVLDIFDRHRHDPPAECIRDDSVPSFVVGNFFVRLPVRIRLRVPFLWTLGSCLGAHDECRISGLIKRS